MYHLSGSSSSASTSFPLLRHTEEATACDFWYCAMLKPKTSFWSTVFQLECEITAWQGGNWKMIYRLLKPIWKPVKVLIHSLHLWVSQYRNIQGEFINTAGAALENPPVDLYSSTVNTLTLTFLSSEQRRTTTRCGMLCIPANDSVQKWICWRLLVQTQISSERLQMTQYNW